MPDRVVLEGQSARLEPLDLVHVEALVMAASEDRASYAYTLVPQDQAAMRSYVVAALEDEKSGWALAFAIRRTSTGEVVGTSRFLDLEYWTGQPAWPPGRPSVGGSGAPTVAEIGSTWLASSAQRSAINTEAKLLMLSHAFDIWAVQRVTFKTDARNARSRQAIERLGATFEGIRRVHALASDASLRDSAYFSIVQAEWPAVRRSLLSRLGGAR
jgi:RimJ/RimL family protein N-acetyltransferase